MNLKEFINRIAENIFWSYNLEESESQYIIKKETSLITVDKEWLKNKLSVLESYELHKFNLYKITEHNEATSFETSIEIEKNFTRKLPLPDIDSTEVNFNISLPSDEYMLLLFNTHKLPNTTLYFLKKELSEGKNCKIQDILNFIVKKLRIYTLKIKSEKSLNCSDFIDLTNSYMIFSAYKHNSVFSIRNPFNVNWIQVLVGRYYSDEIMSKKFEEELINYYKTAILTENPFIEFISFYHIIEYFFEQVKNEFKKEIKLSDIKGFEASEKDLKKILIENKFHDNKMLTLVLIKYINKAELEEEILSYGTNFDYYFNSPVLFADAKPINNDLFYTTLSERIRLIRNSLVHRKEGKKRKYLPFEKEHKNELEKEIILMRAIATQIMIKSSDN